MNFLVLFLTILGFTRGLRAAMMPSKKRDHVKDDFLEGDFLALPGGLSSCCRVSSNHQILSKLGMEWVPLPGLLSLPTPKLAEYKPFSRCDPGRLGGHPAQSRAKKECRQKGILEGQDAVSHSQRS